MLQASGVEEGGGGAEPSSCDLKGVQPLNSANFFGSKSIEELLFCCNRLC